MDLFVNYDCDFATASLFERLVNACVKIAQGKGTVHLPPSGIMSLAASAAGFDSKAEIWKFQDQKLKLRALSVLVSVVTSLLEWIKDLSPELMIFQTRDASVEESRRYSVKEAIVDPAPVILNKRPLSSINMSSVSHILQKKTYPIRNHKVVLTLHIKSQPRHLRMIHRFRSKNLLVGKSRSKKPFAFSMPSPKKDSHF